MKKVIFSLVFAVLVVVFMKAGTLYAQDLDLSEETGNPGDTVQVEVSFANEGSGVVAAQFDVAFDTTRVSFVSAAAGTGLTSGHTVSANAVGGVLTVLITPPLVAPLPEISDGVIALLDFDILAGAAAGASPLTVSMVVYSDAAGMPVTPDEITDGSITVGGAATPTPTPTATPTPPPGTPTPTPPPATPTPTPVPTAEEGGDGGGCSIASGSLVSGMRAATSLFVLLLPAFVIGMRRVWKRLEK